MAAQPSDFPKDESTVLFPFNILTIKSHIGSANAAQT